jgi:GDP-D-mannose dehydratase
MCGIVGYIGPRETAKVLIEGLKRLLETVRIIRQRFHPYSSEILGLLLTFVEDATMFSRQVRQFIHTSSLDEFIQL